MNENISHFWTTGLFGFAVQLEFHAEEVGSWLPTYATLTPQKSEDLTYTAAEAWKLEQ